MEYIHPVEYYLATKSTDIFYNIEEPQKHAKWKNRHKRILYNYMYLKCLELTCRKNRKLICGWQELGGDRNIKWLLLCASFLGFVLFFFPVLGTEPKAFTQNSIPNPFFYEIGSCAVKLLSGQAKFNFATLLPQLYRVLQLQTCITMHGKISLWDKLFQN